MNNFTPGPPRATKSAPTVFCFICGRQFGSKSIAIHEPQCLKKWHAENEKLPKSKRRAAPVKPDAVIGNDGRIDAEATNEVLWKNSQGLMVECEHCGRKFNVSLQGLVLYRIKISNFTGGSLGSPPKKLYC
ncbi:hypothetical protein B9Z55_022531 [Caenorhabditis nigoni]|uniref:C2HC/C3H-type domain-containing protein n=1 Tax=Caenorhabditis nigoni TaxID=1611254 RepID=A0A2G5SKJ0_9PELO|nr:hypothetical protein B9Z55_022531 [Caenorhabditis nigoni]